MCLSLHLWFPKSGPGNTGVGAGGSLRPFLGVCKVKTIFIIEFDLICLFHLHSLMSIEWSFQRLLERWHHETEWRSRNEHPALLLSQTWKRLIKTIKWQLSFHDFFKIFIYLFIYLLAVLGLRCCARAFSSCSEWGLLFDAVHRLLTAVASLVVERGL